MKGSREHRVPLSARALAILEDMKGKGAQIFSGAMAGKPLSDMALLMTLRRMGRGDLTRHGFHSTFRDWCGDHPECRREIAEAALAHAIGDKAEQAYRRSDALKKAARAHGCVGGYCEQTDVASSVDDQAAAQSGANGVDTTRWYWAAG
jgi:integrase